MNKSKIGSRNPVVKTIYEKTITNIDWITEKTHLFVIKLQNPFFAISAGTISIATYISSGYSNDSFQLMYPGW